MFSRSLPFHRIGGMEAVAWDLAKAFVRQGAQVTVVTTAAPNLRHRVQIDGVAIYPLKTPSGRYSLAWWMKSRRAFENEYASQVDAVVSVSAGALSVRRHAGVAMVAQIHGTAWGEFLSKLRHRSLRSYATSIRNLMWLLRDFRYRMFDCLIAVGDAVAAQLGEQPSRFIHGPVPVELVPNGVDPTLFAFSEEARHRTRTRYRFADTDKVILSASRLHEQKGVVEALEGFALASRRNPSLRYLIAGTGPDESRIKSRVKHLGLSDRVMFAGAVPREEIPALLSASDIFLFTTKRVEGMAMNVLEALASGLPVIASQHVGDARFSADLISPTDARAVADAITRAEIMGNRKSRLPVELTLDWAAGRYLSIIEKFRRKAA